MKTKHIILTLAFLAVVFLSNAQEKQTYEYMTLRQYTSPNTHIQVSVDGKEFRTEKLDLNGDQQKGHNPILNFIHKYEGEKWELVGLTFGTGIDATAFMKRKVTEQK